MSASSKNLFISYASTNKSRVRAKIVIPCTEMGHKPWFDHWLIPGQNWQRQLEDHIQACDVFIYVITPPAIKSYWCRWEYNTAIKYQKPIIPLYLKKTEIPAEIKLLQYIDFSGDFLERPTAELQAALLDARFDPTAEPLPLDDHTLRGLPNGAFEGILVFGTVVLLLVLVLGVLMSRLLVSGDETIFVATPESFTDIPSLTQTPFEIASATVEKVITPTPTLTQTATDTATNQPTKTATFTPTDTTTASPTKTRTPTKTPTETTTQTASPTNTATPEIIFTATATPHTTLSPTPDSRALAERGVTHNAEWLPYKEVIDGVEMVLVPKGCFQMGSDADPDEGPIHEVCFERPFWLDLYEVTQAQFEQFNGEKANINFYLGETLPLENITWWEALIYCENRGGRLPTEAEWEFAARGPDSWLYPWGNAFIGDYVAFAGNTTKTVSVGSHSRGMSWTGAMDMSGNVWEWVSSLYKPYPFLLADGRQQEGNQFGVRVVRGGSFNNEELNLRTADRLWFDADNMSGLVGVRCARDYE